MAIISNAELHQMWSDLDDIERAINDLYVDRKVFSTGKVRRLLLAIQAMKARVVALKSS